MSMRWIPLNTEKIAPWEHPSDAKWAFESASPYVIPSHARSSFDPSSGLLEVEFRYAIPEPVSEVRLDRYFTASVGKKSGRLFTVRFDVRAFHLDKSEITNALKTTLWDDRVANPEIVTRAWESRAPRLLAALGD